MCLNLNKYKLSHMCYTDKIIEIFCLVDDFCEEFSEEIVKTKRNLLQGNKRYRNRSSQLSDSEVITIMIGFHLGNHRTFKRYYNQTVCIDMKDLFSKVVCYNHFVRLRQCTFVVFALFLKSRMCKSVSLTVQHWKYAVISGFIHTGFSKELQKGAKVRWDGFMDSSCIWCAMWKDLTKQTPLRRSKLIPVDRLNWPFLAKVNWSPEKIKKSCKN
jgi:hypothetical protein